MLAFMAGPAVFVLKQAGDKLSGTVEGTNISFIGGVDVPVQIEDGKIASGRVSFKAGKNTFQGKVNGDRIELNRSVNFGWATPAPPKEDPNRPDVGPAPDGSDPSISTSWKMPDSIPVVLHRVQR
jgi:beta-galactosidase